MPEPTTDQARRVELTRVVDGILGGTLDRREARRRLARLAGGSADATLNALRHAVEARTTRRWWRDTQASLRAGEPDASARLLQRVRRFLSGGDRHLSHKKRDAPAGLAARLGCGVLVAIPLTLVGVGLWRLAAGLPAAGWFKAAVMTPATCIALMTVSGYAVAMAGVARRQFRAPDPPPEGAGWPLDDAEEVAPASPASSERVINPAAGPARGGHGPSAPLPELTRRLELRMTPEAVRGAAAIRLQGLRNTEASTRRLLWGFYACMPLAWVGLVAGAVWPVLLRVTLGCFFVGMVSILALTLWSLFRHRASTLSFHEPLPVPEEPLPGRGGDGGTVGRAAAFRQALETLLQTTGGIHGSAPLMELRDPRFLGAKVLLVEVLAVAVLLLREGRDFREGEVLTFADALRRPGVTVDAAAAAFARAFPAAGAGRFPSVTLAGVPLLNTD